MINWLIQLPRVGLFLMLCASFGANGEAPDGATVELQLSGLRDASGNIYIAVYNSEDAWLGDTTVLQKKVVIAEALDGDIVRAGLHLQPGEYAFSIFYDSNNNGKLDTNFIGIPKEPLAMSNNARPKFGPPRYEDADFVVADEWVIQRLTIEAI